MRSIVLRAGAALMLASAAMPANALTIVLNDKGGFTNNQAALTDFKAAAA